MKRTATNLKCSFCSKEHPIKFPLKDRINIDCDCGAWGYVSEKYEENLYVLDLQKNTGCIYQKLPTKLMNIHPEGNYEIGPIDLRGNFEIVSSSGIREGNPIYYKWIKKKE